MKIDYQYKIRSLNISTTSPPRGFICSRAGAASRRTEFLHRLQNSNPARLPAYSTFFLRRSTMIPRNRTASTAHTIRTVEVSIANLLSDNIEFGSSSPNL